MWALTLTPILNHHVTDYFSITVAHAAVSSLFNKRSYAVWSGAYAFNKRSGVSLNYRTVCLLQPAAKKKSKKKKVETHFIFKLSLN